MITSKMITVSATKNQQIGDRRKMAGEPLDKTMERRRLSSNSGPMASLGLFLLVCEVVAESETEKSRADNSEKTYAKVESHS